MGRNDLLQQIRSAKSEINAAEDKVRLVVHEMQVSTSGEEVRVSEVVQDAFERLREAKDSLARLEKLLTAAL